MFQVYEVGKKYPVALGHQEGMYFDIDDAGGSLVCYFNSPTPHEIEQFKSGMPFELRMVTLSDIIFMLIKIGDLNWMDAPYTPHLSPNLTKIELPQEGTGLAVTLQLFDCNTGRFEHQKFISLSNSFTLKLLGEVIELGHKDFDSEKYQKNINEVYRKYTTKQLVSLAPMGFKLR